MSETMKKRVQILAVETLDKNWEGRSYKVTECQCIVFGERLEVGVLRLPETFPRIPSVGDYMAQFDLVVDRKTKLLTARIVDLEPLAPISAPSTQQMHSEKAHDKAVKERTPS